LLPRFGGLSRCDDRLVFSSIEERKIEPSVRLLFELISPATVSR
jgi:hypothetical protein